MQERMLRFAYYDLNPRRFKQCAISCRSNETFVAAYNFVAPRHGMDLLDEQRGNG